MAKAGEVRVRLYLSGRVLMTDENGKVLEDFVVDDPRAAYEKLMQEKDRLKRSAGEGS